MELCDVCFLMVSTQAMLDHKRFHKTNGQHASYCPSLVVTVAGSLGGNPCVCPMAYVS